MKIEATVIRISVTVLVFLAGLAAAALAASTNFRELPSSPEAVGSEPGDVVAADFDGDGDQDLATANQMSDDVTILINNGVGNFRERASSPEAAGDFATALAAADFDGDDDQDLAVANDDSNDLTILRNNGRGNFVEFASSPELAGGQGPAALATADFDGDGDQDLAVGVEGHDAVRIHRNNGHGDFVMDAGLLRTGVNPRSVIAQDLDGDADPDIAAGSDGEETVSIFRNDAGVFSELPSSPEKVTGQPHSLVGADFDGDGDTDLATSGGDKVDVLRNNGSANFGRFPSSPESVGDSSWAIAAADFDGDGDHDLAVTHSSGATMAILRNNGGGNFAEPGSSPESAGPFAESVVVTDVDGDGDPDLATANFGDTVTILRNR